MPLASWSSSGKFCVPSSVGSGASLVSISGGSNTFIESYKEYLRSGYMRGWLECPIFDVRLLKRYLQKLPPLCLGRSIPFDDCIHRYSSQGRWALWLDAVKAISVKDNGDKRSFCSWAGRRCQQHNWGVVAHCLLSKGDWKEGQWRYSCCMSFPCSFNFSIIATA